MNYLKQKDLVIIILYATQIFCIPFHFYRLFFPRISLNMVIDFVLIGIITCFVFYKKDLKLEMEEEN